MNLADGMSTSFFRGRVVDANDGIIATAGIVEGLAGAGAAGFTMVVAAFAAMVAGSVALAGAKYTEVALEREARGLRIEEERRRVALSPEQEQDQLAAHYMSRGLSSDLAATVAAELSRNDALGAQIDIEPDLGSDEGPKPLSAAFWSGLAFALGSGVPLGAILVTPPSQRIPVTIVVVVASLVVTGLVTARATGGDTTRALVRALCIGVITMLVSLAAGLLFRR
jgi:VIT1/CCC1 family predicted Fe2+/Mn2+ transporter